MLYEMITGKHPFYVEGDTQASYIERINSLKSSKPKLDLPEYFSRFDKF